MKLTGNGICLRYLKERDAAAKLDLNIRNRSFFEPYVTTRSEDFYTLDYQLSSIASGVVSQQKDEAYHFGVFLTDTSELIGQIALTEVLRGPLQSSWLGYSLDQSQNGRGYTTQAVRLVVDYAFQVLKLHRIQAGVMPHNVGSIRVLEKAGFEREGLNRKNVLINGRWEDHLHFAIVNPNG